MVSGFCHHPSLWCTLLLVSAIHSVCSQVVMWKEKIYPEHVMLCTVFSYKALAKCPSQRPAAFGSCIVHVKKTPKKTSYSKSDPDELNWDYERNWPGFTGSSTLYVLLKFLFLTCLYRFDTDDFCEAHCDFLHKIHFHCMVEDCGALFSTVDGAIKHAKWGAL